MLKKLLLISVLSLGAALPAFADPVSDQVVANLKSQGFVVVQMDRTWLGRMWILARNDEVQREVVFNPATGEILRDYTVLLASLEPRMDNKSDLAANKVGVTTGTPVLVGDPPVSAAGLSDEVSSDVSGVVVKMPINPVQ